LNELKLEVEKSSSNLIINQHFLEKEIKLKDDRAVKFAKISNVKNISRYILIKNNEESISESKKAKQSKSHYVEVVFAGLRQPSKKIDMQTYKVLSAFIKRFKVAYVDVCFDGKCSVPIDAKMYHTQLFNAYEGRKTKSILYGTSFYINAPSAPDKDADYFVKILLYDKYIKESFHKALDDAYRDWKRIEFRVSLDMKFKESEALADYLYSMLPLAKKYFKTDEVDSHYFDKQVRWLTDKRTQGNQTP
jgi:hypothetical protein